MNKYLKPLRTAPDADKPALATTFATEGMALVYETFSRKIGDRKWIVGDKFSTADINCASLFINTINNEANPMYPFVKEGYEHAPANVKAWVGNVREELKDYLATRPSSAH